MAEIIGAISSAATLNDCIVRLNGFIRSFQNASEQLEKYQTVLECIRKSTSLMNDLAEKPASIRAISVPVDGKMEKLIKLYSTNIGAVVNDVQRLLQNFGDAQSEAVMGFLQRVKAFFRGTNRIHLVLNEDYMKYLIQAARHIESSQYIAFSTMLLVQNNFNQRDWQKVFNNLAETMTAESKSFSVLQQTYQCQRTRVVYFQQEMRGASRTLRTISSYVDRGNTKPYMEVQGQSKLQGTVQTVPNYLLPVPEQDVHDSYNVKARPCSNILGVLTQHLAEVPPIEFKDSGEEEKLATIYNDGGFDMLNGRLLDKEASPAHRYSFLTREHTY